MTSWLSYSFFFFFFNDTATTEIYTLSLHDALPISERAGEVLNAAWRHLNPPSDEKPADVRGWVQIDRKSTRLNSSHRTISYAVFCLKKKKKIRIHYIASTNRYITASSRRPRLRHLI